MSRAMVQIDGGEILDAEIINRDKYKPGDGVRLRFGHGGYIMNVVQYVDDPRDGSRRAVTIWLNSNGGLCEAALPEACIEPATND